MKKVLIVIKDKLAGCGNLLSFPNAEAAVRSFKEIMTQDNEISRYAEDQELLAVGNFDSETGVIIGFEEPRILAKGKDYKSKLPDLSRATKAEVAAANAEMRK